MRESKTLLNLPVISVADGLKLGRVKDVVFDTEARSIAAFVVEEAGWFTDTKVVPMSRVRGLGKDAVTVLDRAAVQMAIRVRPIRAMLRSGVKLRGLNVLTEGGNDLGSIDEVLVGPTGGMIAYQISTGFVEDTMRPTRYIRASDALKVGPDAAIVVDDAEVLFNASLLEPLAAVEMAGTSRASARTAKAAREAAPVASPELATLVLAPVPAQAGKALDPAPESEGAVAGAPAKPSANGNPAGSPS